MFRNFDGVVRQLSSNGHSVTLLFGNMQRHANTDRALRACLSESPRCKAGLMFLRDDRWGLLLNKGRVLRNYAFYLSRPHVSWERLAEDLERRMPRYAKAILPTPAVRSLGGSALPRKGLPWIEDHSSPDPEVKDWLAENRPDAVFASPFIYNSFQELEYVKSAKELGIPTIVAVGSWDHLTTKGTFLISPDLVLVWNEALASEAVAIHRVPKEKVVVTGAPTFDFWFEMGAPADRASFCSQVGLDDDGPFVAYLCSSTSVTGDETSFVGSLARSLSEHPDTRHLKVLVRPHPLNATIWKGFSADNVRVWPEGGDIADVQGPREDYYNTLFHSAAVVGVNTSALLEAVIVDRPCVTIMTGQYRESQIGRAHFQHLLNGDFMETASDFDEAASVLSRIIGGDDAKADNRRRFIKDFIRPLGIEKPASQVIAHIVESTARGEMIEQAPAGTVPARVS